MSTNTKFETFEGVSHMPLRVFNRVVTSFNIKEDFGEAVLEKYLGKFDATERQQMMIMTMAIKSKGVEEVRKYATAGLELGEDV